jgi:hypothetical protein
MRASTNALRASGLRRLDVVELIRRYPPVLERNPTSLKLLMELLRERCGLRKVYKLSVFAHII